MGGFLKRFLIIKQILVSLIELRHSLLFTLNWKDARKLPLMFILHRDAQRALYKFALSKNSLSNITEDINQYNGGLLRTSLLLNKQLAFHTVFCLLTWKHVLWYSNMFSFYYHIRVNIRIAKHYLFICLNLMDCSIIFL